MKHSSPALRGKRGETEHIALQLKLKELQKREVIAADGKNLTVVKHATKHNARYESR